VKIRTTVLTLAVVASLGATAGVALAGPGEGEGNGPRNPAARCERAEHFVQKLHRFETRLENRIAKLTERIESGELEGEKLERAQAWLEKLTNRLAHLQERIAAIEARIAEHCGDAEPA
jgi:peptidoglycan hydrolase CwlO-like protein